jgi:hypothetical protein
VLELVEPPALVVDPVPVGPLVAPPALEVVVLPLVGPFPVSSDEHRA